MTGAHKSLHDSSILREIDTNNNGKVELEEYLAVMCAIKTGAVSHSRYTIQLTYVKKINGKVN